MSNPPKKKRWCLTCVHMTVCEIRIKTERLSLDVAHSVRGTSRVDATDLSDSWHDTIGRECHQYSAIGGGS